LRRDRGAHEGEAIGDAPNSDQSFNSGQEATEGAEDLRRYLDDNSRRRIEAIRSTGSWAIAAGRVQEEANMRNRMYIRKFVLLSLLLLVPAMMGGDCWEDFIEDLEDWWEGVVDWWEDLWDFDWLDWFDWFDWFD
jgi:hypothetical protein